MKDRRIIRFRTSWVPGEPEAVVGFTADLPLDVPIVFTKENGRLGWRSYRQKKKGATL